MTQLWGGADSLSSRLIPYISQLYQLQPYNDHEQAQVAAHGEFQHYRAAEIGPQDFGEVPRLEQNVAVDAFCDFFVMKILADNSDWVTKNSQNHLQHHEDLFKDIFSIYLIS